MQLLYSFLYGHLWTGNIHTIASVDYLLAKVI
jgi:hypothetical protein